MTNSVLEIRDLRCERDERCLFHNLSLQVYPGDIIQVEGPNGCGKTTLLRVLTTVSHDYQGDILWRGKKLREERLDYLNHLIYLSHLASVKKALSPRQNLLWYSGMASGHTQMPIAQALDAVGLYGYEDSPCYTLSAGQLRRVSLARLYLTPAQIWVLDEPFTAIDKQGVDKLESLLMEHASGGGSVIFTTHQSTALTPVKHINLEHYCDDSLRSVPTMLSEKPLSEKALLEKALLEKESSE